MSIIKISKAISGDLMIADGWADEVGYSDDCKSFLTKLCAAKLNKFRNSKWYEVEASDDEIVAVCQEVVLDLIERVAEMADEFCVSSKDRADCLRHLKRLAEFLDEHCEEDL